MDLVDKTKQIAAEKAVDYILDNMVVGLGTGSTTKHAIIKIAERIRDNSLKIPGGVPTSVQSKELAIELGIPLLSKWEKVDVTIDGADEVDVNGCLIKGGGGALTWEKIVAANTKKQIIVVDESKLVQTLGRFPLPVEVIPFGWEVNKKKIEKLGCKSEIRKKNNNVIITDNHNYILDCFFGKISNPRELSMNLNSIPGVLENGLFVGLTNLVIVGNRDGSIKEITF